MLKYLQLEELDINWRVVMIKKLRNKISLIILLSVSIPLLLIISFYTYSYYDNTIKSTTLLIDRIYGDNKNPSIKDNNIDILNIDGIYLVNIKDSEVLKSSENIDEVIEKYALEAYNKNTNRGIIGDYIYQKRKEVKKEDGTDLILIESSNQIHKIHLVFILSFCSFLLTTILIYIIARKIAKSITKPVEESFIKQKEFISDASHELKTPLAVISANADVLEQEMGKNKWLTYIQNETDNMSKLISELLLLSKLENTNNIRIPEEFNISDYIELVISSFESMAYEKEVSITTNIESNIITNNFNKNDILHILSTLVDNAIKHTSSNNKIIVDLKKHKDYIIIEVKNEGEPIPTSDRDKIFERFYRVDKSRNRQEKRYGLGLSIASSIVNRYSGTISVDCKNGLTIFTVKLPI